MYIPYTLQVRSEQKKEHNYEKKHKINKHTIDINI